MTHQKWIEMNNFATVVEKLQKYYKVTKPSSTDSPTPFELLVLFKMGSHHNSVNEVLVNAMFQKYVCERNLDIDYLAPHERHSEVWGKNHNIRY